MSPGLEEQTLGEFLRALADRTPTPGGGAVAATSLALAGAMAHMAVVYSQGRNSLSSFESLHREAVHVLSDLPSEALDMAQQDADAYANLNDLWKRESDDPIRIDGWDEAVDGAIDAPMKVMQKAYVTLELLSRLVDATTPMLRSDLAVSAIMTESAARSAHCNVLINLPNLTDQNRAEVIKRAAAASLENCRRLTRTIEHDCQT